MDITGGRGVQVGDHSTQVNDYTRTYVQTQVVLPPPAPVPGQIVAGNVPQAPPAFQPREDLMAALATAGPGVRAVTGMRGAGKTQLAAAYARDRIDAGWRLVAWVSAEDTPAILGGLAVVAARLGIDRPGTALEIIAGAVRNRLEADGDRCLLVFDNAADPDELRPYLPSAGKAQVLITSTDAATESLGKLTPVGVFTEQESLGFLAERTGRGDAHADAQEAGTLAAELGYLPLALAQAAAVIAAQHLTYPAYLARLRSYPVQRYLPRHRGDPYPRGVAETILLSVDAVTTADPAGLSGDLLGIASFLSPQGVSRDLLRLGPSAGICTAGPDEVDEAIGTLADASLVTFGAADAVIAHRMTMRVVREQAERAGSAFTLAAKACMLLEAARAAQGEPRLNRAEVRQFAQQVAVLNEHAATLTAGHSAAPGGDYQAALAFRLIHLRVWALSFLNLSGDAVTQAVGMAEPLLADCERVLGPAHPGTLSMQANLGYAYRAAGRLAEAVEQYERALAACERVLGPAHPDTLSARNNLGAAYDQAGRTAGAIDLLERTVAERERALGAEHPLTLTSRNNLASAYQNAGRPGEGFSQLEKSLAGRERVLGADHPDSARARANLAHDLLETGRTGEALALYERTAADYERILGPGHPESLVVVSGLAESQRAAGRLPEAIRRYEEAVAGLEQSLGASHPVTVMTRKKLAEARQEAAAGETGRADAAPPN